MGFFLPLCFVSVFWALTFLFITCARTRSLYYNIYAYTKHLQNHPFSVFYHILPKNPQKSSKIRLLKINELQRKCIFYVIFLQKYLVNSKKSSTFAIAFEKQVCFDFLPEARTLKFRFTYVDLIFLRQTEG